MGLKPGYKQTEVGMIPEEWELYDFDALGRVIDGDRGTQYPNSEDFSNDGHCLFLNAGNVTKEGFRFGECAFITREKDARLNKGKLKRNDIVLTTRGTVGNLAYFDAAVPFESMRINSGMVILRNASSSLDTTFLYALLQSRLVQMQIERLSFGSAQPQLTVRGISKFGIVVPPLSEQRAIAGVLGDVDALLLALEKLIAKKRDLKQAAMQQLLTGIKRLPGFTGQWEVKTIKEVVVIPVTDGPHLTPEFLSDGIPFLSVNNLIGNKIDLNDLRFISRGDHELFSRKCRPERNDLLLGKAASVGKVALVDFDVEFNIWSPIALIRLNSQYSPKFFYHCFQSANVIRQITLFTNSSSQGNLGMGDIEKLEFPVPPLAEQTAITAVLSDMDAEIVALEQRRDKTRALKQGMMQELLTGKTRLI
jgi:type I restriction enzyme S subunit